MLQVEGGAPRQAGLASWGSSSIPAIDPLCRDRPHRSGPPDLIGPTTGKSSHRVTCCPVAAVNDRSECASPTILFLDALMTARCSSPLPCIGTSQPQLLIPRRDLPRFPRDSMVSVLSSSTRNLTALGKITGFIKNSSIHPPPPRYDVWARFHCIYLGVRQVLRIEESTAGPLNRP